jgi:hypothetical protein
VQEDGRQAPRECMRKVPASNLGWITSMGSSTVYGQFSNRDKLFANKLTVRLHTALTDRSTDQLNASLLFVSHSESAVLLHFLLPRM